MRKSIVSTLALATVVGLAPLAGAQSLTQTNGGTGLPTPAADGFTQEFAFRARQFTVVRNNGQDLLGAGSGCSLGTSCQATAEAYGPATSGSYSFNVDVGLSPTFGIGSGSLGVTSTSSVNAFYVIARAPSNEDGVLALTGLVLSNGTNTFNLADITAVGGSGRTWALYGIDVGSLVGYSLGGTITSTNIAGTSQEVPSVDFVFGNTAEMATVTPEPATLGLLGTGLLGLGAFARRRRRAVGI